MVNIPVEDHKASAMFEHAYLKVPDFVRILVYDNTKENVLLGEELAMVEMENNSLQGEVYTLNFRFDMAVTALSNYRAAATRVSLRSSWLSTAPKPPSIVTKRMMISNWWLPARELMIPQLAS